MKELSLKKLVKAKDIYDTEIRKIEDSLNNLIRFDFFVMYQQSDGFVIVHQERSHNAPLRTCISIIEDKGELSYEDYIRICI